MGVVQGRSEMRHVEVNVKAQKRKKRRTTRSAVTQTHGSFRHSELDTVPGWGWRIFLCKGVVQGRSEMRHVEVNVKAQKMQKKANH